VVVAAAAVIDRPPDPRVSRGPPVRAPRSLPRRRQHRMSSHSIIERPLMNPKSYRILTDPSSTRVRCPVCHEAVYSRAGIHPQCAVRLSDPPKPKNKPPSPPGDAQPIA
jgi:hypothetical protein